MKFMNVFDLDEGRARFTQRATPNRLALVLVVDALREWADLNSDGWAHWRQPVDAARRAIEHIESRTNQENEYQERFDVDNATMRRAVTPIRAFLTRQNATAEEKEQILRSIDAPTLF